MRGCLSLCVLVSPPWLLFFSSSVRKLQLCDELDRSSCGNVLFNGYLPPPGRFDFTSRTFKVCVNLYFLIVFSCSPVYPAKRRNRHSVAGPQYMGGCALPMERAPVRRSNTMPPNLGNAGILGKATIEERISGGKASESHTHLTYAYTFYKHFATPAILSATHLYVTNQI